ncbi:hypothetical protein B0H13DRAFT_2319528 [Mycena leptocephala]|nr:hypothetical protein B0H13DRAFT_2319528 [Mycena leptocephala]
MPWGVCLGEYRCLSQDWDHWLVDSSPVDMFLPPGFPFKTELSSAPRLDETRGMREKGEPRLPPVGHSEDHRAARAFGTAGIDPKTFSTHARTAVAIGSFGSCSLFLLLSVFRSPAMFALRCVEFRSIPGLAALAP